MDIELKYDQALDVIVGLSSDIQELKNEIERLKARNSRYAEKIIELKDKLKYKENLDKNVKVIVRDQAKKVKHLFPLENTAGYGQLCDKLLKFEKALKFYADKENYECVDDRLDHTVSYIHIVDTDEGYTARKALELERD